MKSKKLVKTLAILVATVFCFGFLFSTTPVLAAGCTCPDGMPAEVCNANCGGGNQLPSVIVNILNAIIAAAGLVAVIFVVVGGINYMTSSGDPGKVKKAKDTILYAIIGLIVCVLAFAIVNFVITNIIK